MDNVKNDIKKTSVNEDEMIIEKTWEEFKDNGFLWLVNSLLSLFGWSIVVEYESFDNHIDNETETSPGVTTIINNPPKIIRAYPARVKYRGFSETLNDKGYKNITNYMVTNSKELLKDIEEDDK